MKPATLILGGVASGLILFFFGTAGLYWLVPWPEMVRSWIFDQPGDDADRDADRRVPQATGSFWASGTMWLAIALVMLSICTWQYGWSATAAMLQVVARVLAGSEIGASLLQVVQTPWASSGRLHARDRFHPVASPSGPEVGGTSR